MKIHPELLPKDDDIGFHTADHGRPAGPHCYAPPDTHRMNDLTARLPQSVVNMAPVLGKLIHGKGLRARSAPGWSPAHRPWLLSLTSGGQWPQSRICKASKDEVTDQCMLCAGAVGTLQHRLECPATTPEGGWPVPEASVRDFITGLEPQRRRLLEANGLFLLRTSIPHLSREDWFQWIRPPPSDLADDAVWYVDGSFLDGPSQLLGRTGYGIAVLSPDGRLAAYGYGAPPAWATSAPAAEIWAYHVVLTMCPTPPYAVTDCLGVLRGLQEGSAAATNGKRLNARIWRNISLTLEGTPWDRAAERLLWMPAHGGRSSIGRARRSDGEAVTLANWLGNRLVDALAKAAAARSRVPARTRDLVATAAKAYSFCASKAGVATYKSNNCAHTAAGDDGQLRQQRLRDALPPEAVRMGTAHGNASDHPAPDPQASPRRRPRLAPTLLLRLRRGTAGTRQPRPQRPLRKRMRRGRPLSRALGSLSGRRPRRANRPDPRLLSALKRYAFAYARARRRTPSGGLA